MQAFTKRTEQAALFSSVVGLPLAVIFEQFLIAAAPLTLALSLGTLNRYRLETQLQQAVLAQQNAEQTLQAQQSHLNTQLETQLGDLQAELRTLQTEFETLDQVRLSGAIATLEQLGLDLTEAKQAAAITLQAEVGQLNTLVDVLQADLSDTKQTATTSLQTEIEQLNTLVSAVRSDLTEVEQTAATALQVEAQHLKGAVDNLAVDTSSITDRIKTSIDLQVKTVETAVDSVQYQLIYDRHHSRQVLLDALEAAEERLILVCPWLSNDSFNGDYNLDEGLKGVLERRLNHGVCIQIGYGCRQDINTSIQKVAGPLHLYSALAWLENLADQYPNFELRAIGTNEKYLVCDRKFAMLGSHNFLCSGNNADSQDLEVGIRTSDQNIINSLINRFDGAKGLIQAQTRTRAKQQLQTA